MRAVVVQPRACANSRFPHSSSRIATWAAGDRLITEPIGGVSEAGPVAPCGTAGQGGVTMRRALPFIVRVYRFWTSAPWRKVSAQEARVQFVIPIEPPHFPAGVDSGAVFWCRRPPRAAAQGFANCSSLSMASSCVNGSQVCNAAHRRPLSRSDAFVSRAAGFAHHGPVAPRTSDAIERCRWRGRPASRYGMLRQQNASYAILSTSRPRAACYPGVTYCTGEAGGAPPRR